METRELFICNHCKLLLINIETAWRSFGDSSLNADGGYEYNSQGDAEIEYYNCPKCDGSDIHRGTITTGNGHTYDSETLTTIEVPKNVIKKILQLWEQLRHSKSIDAYRGLYEHGIPLDTPELKQILTEALI